jgi:hypothetical protein
MLYQRIVCDRCGAEINPDRDTYLSMRPNVRNYMYMESSEEPTHHYCDTCRGDFFKILRWFDDAGKLPHE